MFQPGLQFTIAAHTSASDSVFGWHCALYGFTYRLTYCMLQMTVYHQKRC